LLIATAEHGTGKEERNVGGLQSETIAISVTIKGDGTNINTLVPFEMDHTRC
jgi:hypothetical protein